MTLLEQTRTKRSGESGLGVVVCGAAGRMGSTLVRLIHENRAMKLAGAVESSDNPEIDKDAGEVAGVGKIGVPIVIGTTGLNQKQLAEIKRLSSKTRVLISANMSLGVNLLVSLMGRVAKTLGDDYDVEIVEAHHRFKKDAPSGTALALAQPIAQALGRDLDRAGVCGRKGIVGERTKQEIGLLSVRAGDIVGEHTVIFGGLGERVEFIHRAQSRETFARGALRAAQWLVKQKKGLYGMQDVLGL